MRRSGLVVGTLVIALAAFLAGACEYEPRPPTRPPPSRGLPPEMTKAPPPPRPDPYQAPVAKLGRNPRPALSPDPRIGGGGVARMTKAQHTPTYAAAPGRDLHAELTQQVARAGLQSCLSRTGTRTESTWQIDWASPDTRRQERVERVEQPSEPARTVRVRATFNLAGRVSSSSVSVSPAVSADAQRCMEARVEALAIAPLRAVQTVETSVGLAPSG